MKRTILLLAFLVLWATLADAQTLRRHTDDEDAHHSKLHEGTHQKDGGDEIVADDLATRCLQGEVLQAEMDGSLTCTAQAAAPDAWYVVGEPSTDVNLSAANQAVLEDEVIIRNADCVNTAVAGIPAGALCVSSTTTPGIWRLNAARTAWDVVPVGDVNVQADWNESDTASDAYIANKPTITDTTLTIGTSEPPAVGTNTGTPGTTGEVSDAGHSHDGPNAAQVAVSVTNNDGVLDSGDNDVQDAFDRLDNYGYSAPADRFRMEQPSGGTDYIFYLNTDDDLCKTEATNTLNDANCERIGSSGQMIQGVFPFRFNATPRDYTFPMNLGKPTMPGSTGVDSSVGVYLAHRVYFDVDGSGLQVPAGEISNFSFVLTGGVGSTCDVTVSLRDDGTTRATGTVTNYGDSSTVPYYTAGTTTYAISDGSFLNVRLQGSSDCSVSQTPYAAIVSFYYETT